METLNGQTNECIAVPEASTEVQRGMHAASGRVRALASVSRGADYCRVYKLVIDKLLSLTATVDSRREQSDTHLS